MICRYLENMYFLWEKLMHDSGMTFFDESDISRAAPKLKFFMIEPKQVKYGGQPVVMINNPIDCMVGEFVC